MMKSKHDTWVNLKPGTELDAHLHLFPIGIPMRDPFPLEVSRDGLVSLCVVDHERLTSDQIDAIATAIADKFGATVEEVLAEAARLGGLRISQDKIQSMHCGPEGFARSKELADLLEQPPDPQAWAEFYKSQYERWINGSQTPPPIHSIDDIDPRLRMPEQERSLKIHNQAKDYSCP